MTRLAEHAPAQRPLVLIVEDEPLIALELETILQEAGLRVMGPAATLRIAFQLLDHRRPDAAVLDINLRGELVTPVAKLLQAMQVPFVVSSAYSNALLQADPVLAGSRTLGSR